MKKILLSVLILTALLVFPVFASVILVSNDTDSSLYIAARDAAPGDVLELNVDGIYQLGKRIDIEKELTIRGAATLAHKPVLKCVEKTAGTFFKLIENSKVTLENLEMAGITNVGGVDFLGKYAVIADTSTVARGPMVIKIKDCVIHDFTDQMFKPYKKTMIDTLIITNTFFHHGGKEGVVLYTGSTSDGPVNLNYAEITNCTFWAFQREAIKGQVNPVTKVRIDRCTFYDMGEAQKKQMVYFSNMTDVILKNSIFTKNHNTETTEMFAQFTDSTSLFKNSIVWDVNNWLVKNATVSDTLHVDPLFADTANGDFTLPTDSRLLTFADDGKAVGDPRWVPAPVGPKVWEVSAGTDVLAPAIAAADTGDIIELVTDGGVYLTSDLLDIGKDLTVRGKATLMTKPVIKYTGTSISGYFFKIVNNPRIHIENIDMNGDGISAGATALVKNGFSINNSDTTGTIKLYIDNCLIHDVAEKGIRCEKNSGIDSLVVTNCIISKAGSEGVTLYSGTSTDPAAYIRYAEFRNSTFHTIEREAIKGQVYPKAVVRIDRCTFYDLGEAEKKQMVYFANMTDVVLKNSIFARNHNTETLEQFAQFASSASIFKNNVVWDVNNWTVKNATVSDTLRVDPQFVNTAGYDFTIQNPALLTFADDGDAVGDPRWAPTGKVTLKVNVVGTGTVALNPTGGLYDAGTVVTMTATPAEFWAFDGWSPNVLTFPPTNPVAQMTVNDNTVVTAYFIPTVMKRTVTIGAVGLGHVDVVEHPKFSAEGYFDGDTLVFTASSDTTTWEFAYWINAAGDSIGITNPLTWVVSVDSVFRAKFRSLTPQVTLNVTIEGLGVVVADPKPVPGFTTYDQGTVVTLTAEPVIGWEITSWTGDLTGTDKVKQVTLTTSMTAVAHFSEIAVPTGELLVDNSWDIRNALEFAKNNTQVKVIKLIQSGPFIPSESDRVNAKLPELNISFPVTIVGADTLSVKPVIKGWGEGGSEGLFRLRENGHLTLANLEIDGYFAEGKITKYTFRLDDAKDINVSVKANNVDFHGAGEVFLKFYPLAHADTMRFTNCKVWDIGKEGIFDNTLGTSDYVELKNCTFHHVGREIVRFKIQTPKTIIDHVTVENCGYGFGAEGAKFSAFKFEKPNNVAITNTIIVNVTNTAGYAVRFYGAESRMNNSLLFNSPRVDDNDGSILGEDIFWYDPMFVDVATQNYTLKDSSVAYHLAGDGAKAIGDLRWATSTSIANYFALKVTSNEFGKADVSPAPMAKFYVPGTVVTLTADADTLYKLGSWSGDLTGNTSPVNLTMNGNKSVAATFVKAYFAVDLNVNMSYWATLGKFHVSADSVDAAGSFNGWGGGLWLRDIDGDSIYTAQVKIDENIPHFEWKFRINGVWNDATGEFPYGGPNRVFTATQDSVLTFWYNDEKPQVGIAGEPIPERYALEQNYPNPFNPTTTIVFALKNPGMTKLIVYDMLGRQVATLVNRHMEAGYHKIIVPDFNLTSGIYFYQITSGSYTAIKKMMLMK